MKLIHLFQLIVAIWSNQLVTSLFFKTQKRHHTVSENIQSKFTDAVQCGMFKHYLEKALLPFTICQKFNCYRSTTLLFGLGWTIVA